MKTPLKKQKIARTCLDLGILIVLLIFGKIFFDYSPVYAFLGDKQSPKEERTATTTTKEPEKKAVPKNDASNKTKTSNNEPTKESVTSMSTQPVIENDPAESSTKNSTDQTHDIIYSDIDANEELTSKEDTTDVKKNEEKLNTAPTKEAIGPNMVGINGSYKPYTQLGDVGTDTIQTYVDNGNIITALTYFDPSDNQTTYIAGHNPGIMAYFEQHMSLGASVGITDNDGNLYYYNAVDHVTVDTDGTSVFNSLNMSAIDAYAYGTGQESLLIQYCNSHDGLITMWYLLPQ